MFPRYSPRDAGEYSLKGELLRGIVKMLGAEAVPSAMACAS